MDDIDSILEHARKDLLELTTRNRLLNTPRRQSRATTIEAVDERSDQIFDLLVHNRRKMGFLARPQASGPDDPDQNNDPFADLAPPDDEDLNAAGIAARHRDSWLQTALSPERLQRALLKLYYDARTAYEERGVNILYLALGFLEWRDSPNSDQGRHAPLLLVPVQLERGSAHERFRLIYAEDEIITNLTLREKLKEFALQLPDIDEDEELVPTSYFKQVAQAVADEQRFVVHRDDVVLGLFSFTRLLMYRDLDPANWPEGTELDQQPLVRAVLLDGFRDEPAGISENQFLDDLLSPLDAIHVLDADSSQVTAIEEVRRGGNLLIQGPPGTGKSQTIANLIVGAAHAGKKVLFVAEKMAALEVVHRRLSNLGLGTMCLELHSYKANKRTFLADLKQTLSLGRPRLNDATLAGRLADVRARLNDHANTIHAELGPSGHTPFSLLGEFVRLAQRGMVEVDFVLSEAVHWTHDDIDARQSVIEELGSLLTRMGSSPSEHIWRGTRLDVVLPPDQARIGRQIPAIADHLDKAQQAVNHLEHGLGVASRNTTPSEIRRLLNTCQHLNAAPNGMDLHALLHPVWREHRETVAELVARGQAVANGRARLQEIFVDQAWTAELGRLRHELADRGRSWMRWLSPTYRRLRRDFATLLVGAVPRRVEQQLALLDDALELRQAEERLASQQTLGVSAFGRLWNGKESDWKFLADIERWEHEGRGECFLPHASHLLLKLGEHPGLVTFTEQISKHFEETLSLCQALFDALHLDLAEAFGYEALDDIELPIALDRVRAWQARTEDLDCWLNYRHLNARARGLDLAPLVERLYDGRLSPGIARDALSFAICEPLMREAWGRFPNLAGFDGVAHDRRVERFRQLDKERIDLTAAEVAFAHFEGLPKSSGDLGEMRVLLNEFNKRRRHLPIRKLIAQAGQAIQAIKPVFMMSPLSVAEFLAPGGLRFDLLLIDEASQVEPVDALGAVARADRMVVVGDDRQLPPTKFFRGGHLVEDDASDEEQTNLGDIESILGKCAAQGMPQRMLRWHYRSRHPSLIAVSNQEFYDSRLFIVPNAQPDSTHLGLRFHNLPKAIYERGGARWNLIEAKAVAEAVMRHACEQPELSLGVGCFSISQRDAVLHEVELLRRERGSEDFFAAHPEEPFFVKNLENIQGDERDVIMISVGYGRDASGYMAMSFGPINAEGGERRLNVLISRAKRRCEVFSSITADDIDLSRAPRPGVKALKAFLKYAETGVMDVPLSVGEADSVFEEQVAAALIGLGHEVELQVGTAGFFVDLAVRDPVRPGRYLLGIECDGAAYHSARSARDRDRLRQQVLEDHGWIIHRIWSTDWFRQPQKQLGRTVEAIEQAKLEWSIRDRRTDESKPKSDRATRTIQRESIQPVDAPSDSRLATPYVEADFLVPGSPEPHLLPRDRMVDIIHQIVDVEGPIHRDEIARRVTRVCGYARTGKRIVDAVATGVRLAVERGIVAQEGDFINNVEGSAPTVRDRSCVQSPSLRRPEMLPPSEIRTAVLNVIGTHLGVSVEEAVIQVSRILGFQATSAQLRSVSGDELDRLIADGLVEQKPSGALAAVEMPPRPNEPFRVPRRADVSATHLSRTK